MTRIQTTRKIGALATIVSVLWIGLALSSPAGLAPDGDGDGVPDVLDNCDVVANASPLDCDTDEDGYGNRCDGDLNNSGGVNVQDFNLWRAAWSNPASPDYLDADLNCNGAVSLQDFNLWRINFANPENLSSGLSCAGTIPCS